MSLACLFQVSMTISFRGQKFHERSPLFSLFLAALLHEADDHKYFKSTSENARDILSTVLQVWRFPLCCSVYFQVIFFHICLVFKLFFVQIGRNVLNNWPSSARHSVDFVTKISSSLMLYCVVTS
jgi:hypothetical protein